MTVVLALMLLAILSLAAFGMAQGSIRELTTTGTVVQGGKAGEAADAGLSWVLVWGHSTNMAANANATTAAGMLADAMNALRSRDPGYAFRDPAKVSWVGNPSNLAVQIVSAESAQTTSGMVFDTGSTLVAQNSGGGNRVIQRFDLTIRYLGSVRQALNSVNAGASAGTEVALKAPEDMLFSVSSTGYASVDLGGSYMRYQQRRDMIGQQNTAQ